jgi:Avidin family
MIIGVDVSKLTWTPRMARATVVKTPDQERSLLPFRVIALCIGVLALPFAARSQPLAPQATWANDHARFVIQSIDPDGKLTGTYENFGTNFSCASQVFPVTGWVDGERISYAVHRKNPGDCTSVQAWTGYVRGDELLVDYVAVFWDGTQNVVLRGADRYRKQ